MKKVNIVTIYDPNPNYGNRLQNYAVQCVLEKRGFCVETISFEKKFFSGKNLIKILLHKLTAYKIFPNGDYWKATEKRVCAFDRFNKKFIRTKRIKSIKQIGNADYYVVGSDQVWNPEWYSDCPMKKEMYLLSFAESKKRVCMSPSFGVESLPQAWCQYFKEQLTQFPKLSVREAAGAHIIKQLTGRSAEVLVDPTMLLSKSDWEKISRKPQKVNCDCGYILTYFIGKKTEEQEQYIKNIAKSNKLEVYNLLDPLNSALYQVDPSEFIYMIEHARIVFTDSFHACVFSILFEKPFQVFKRNGKEGNMFSRIENILEKFSLQRKNYENRNMNDLFECDYSKAKDVLLYEREKANRFLNESFE